MKRILLLGDSIRMGYDKYVQGLRSPNEVDPRYYKVGPLSPLKCCANNCASIFCVPSKISLFVA